MTSSYKVSKEQGSTFTYEPTNSPNIFSTAVESSPKPLMANEKVIRTEKVIEEKVFPNSSFKDEGISTFASSNTNLGSGLSSSIPKAPTPPPVMMVAPYKSNLPFNRLISDRIGGLKKTQTREMTFDQLKTKLFPDTTKGVHKFNEPLKPTTASNPTGGSVATKPVPKDSALHNLNDKPASLKNPNAGTTSATNNNLGSTATKPTATKAEAAHTGEHYTEPHKPSQIKHVKGIIKEKVGHITKNARMESNGKALEAEFEREKFDYQAFQHNSGSK